MDDMHRAERRLLRREVLEARKKLATDRVDPFQVKWAFEAIGAVALNTERDDIRKGAMEALTEFAKAGHWLSFAAADVLIELPAA